MVFVRFAGCNLLPHCIYCDTKYSQKPEDGKDMDTGEVVGEVSKLLPYYGSWVEITGGEPLWQEQELEQLVRKLKQGGYKITVETNGSFKPPYWYTLVDSWNADIKCPSSGMCGVSKEEWFKTRQVDQIKFCVGNTEDLEFTKGILNRHKADNPIILVSPIAFNLIGEDEVTEYWDKEWLKEVWEFCLENRVRFSLQIHKLVWGSKKGV
jgi:organic radical activating enzyme